jgi:hypothetical protein
LAICVSSKVSGRKPYLFSLNDFVHVGLLGWVEARKIHSGFESKSRFVSLRAKQNRGTEKKSLKGGGGGGGASNVGAAVQRANTQLPPEFLLSFFDSVSVSS